jgi:hypothetical protein
MGRGSARLPMVLVAQALLPVHADATNRIPALPYVAGSSKRTHYFAMNRARNSGSTVLRWTIGRYL